LSRKFTFKDLAGALITPDSVTVVVVDPKGISHDAYLIHNEQDQGIWYAHYDTKPADGPGKFKIVLTVVNSGFVEITEETVPVKAK
jgi:hypothetical protein